MEDLQACVMYWNDIDNSCVPKWEEIVPKTKDASTDTSEDNKPKEDEVKDKPKEEPKDNKVDSSTDTSEDNKDDKPKEDDKPKDNKVDASTDTSEDNSSNMVDSSTDTSQDNNNMVDASTDTEEDINEQTRKMILSIKSSQTIVLNIEIKYFDDVIRTFSIHEGQKIKIIYIKDGKLLTKIGKVSKILNLSYITLDSAKECESSIDYIHVKSVRYIEEIIDNKKE